MKSRFIVSACCLTLLAGCSDNTESPTGSPPPNSTPTFVSSFTPHAKYGVSAIDLAADGNSLYVADAFGSVNEYSTNGDSLSTWVPRSQSGTLLQPFYLAMHKGEFYCVCAVPAPSRISINVADGGALVAWPEKYDRSAMGWPSPTQGIVVDELGMIYTLLYDKATIIKYRPDGSYEREWAAQGTEPTAHDRPSGIAISPAATIYVSDTLRHRILKFRTDGGFAGEFGERGEGSGQLEYPIGLAFDDDGLLYVADTYNYRVQKFEPDGTYLSEFQVDNGFGAPSLITIVHETVAVLDMHGRVSFYRYP